MAGGVMPHILGTHKSKPLLLPSHHVRCARCRADIKVVQVAAVDKMVPVRFRCPKCGDITRVLNTMEFSEQVSSEGPYYEREMQRFAKQVGGRAKETIEIERRF